MDWLTRLANETNMHDKHSQIMSDMIMKTNTGVHNYHIFVVAT